MNPVVLPDCPYKGLVPYDEKDAPFFFGRDADREIITANLMASHLTLLYGSSGVGKSSVLRAGVGYHLCQQALDNLRRWKTPEFTIVLFSSWQDDPVVALLAGVRSTFKSMGLDPANAPSSNTKGLAEQLYALARWSNGDLFIVLDQFEEYFLYHGQEDGEGTFAVEFPRAVNFLPPQVSSGKPEDRLFHVNFLIAIREDSYAKLDRFKGRIPNLYDNYLRVRHLDPDAARKAIVNPLEKYNSLLPEGQDKITIEPELVDAVLDQVRTGTVVLGEPDAVPRGAGGAKPDASGIETPFLQLVMTRLWHEERQRASRNLSLATLAGLGGAANIVRKHFDDVMETLADAERDVAAHTLRFLITPSGTKVAYSAADLAAFASVSEQEVESLLAKLSGQVRILRKVEPAAGHQANRFEIFHDVMARGILAWVAQYRQAKEQAEAAKKAEARAEYERHLRQTAEAEREAERERRLREAAEAAREAERIRAEEAEARKQAAEAAARRQKKLGSRLLVAAIIAGVLAATSGGLAVWANNSRKLADILRYDAEAAAARADTAADLAAENEKLAKDFTRLADAGRIAGLSEAQRDKHLDRAFLLAVEAVRTESTPGTRNSLLQAFLARPRLFSFLHPYETVNCVAFSPDGKTLAAGVVGSGRGSDRSRLVLWDAAQHEHRDVPVPDGTGSVMNVAFSPDGKTIAVGTSVFGNSGHILFWSTKEHNWPSGVHLAVPDGAVHSLAFSHDGKTLAAGYHDLNGTNSGLVFWNSDGSFWQLADQQPVTEGEVLSVAFRPKAKTLAVGYGNLRAGSGGVMLVSWDDAQGKWLHRKSDPLPDGLVTSVAFSADGKFLAAGVQGRKGGVIRWDGAELKRLQPEPLPVPEGDVWSIAFSCDGNLAAGLIEAQVRGGVVLWNAAQGTRLQPGLLPVPEGKVGANCLAFSPDGKTLATGLSILPRSGAVLLWNMTQSIIIRTEPQPAPDGATDRVATSPDGKRKAKATPKSKTKTGGVLLCDVTQQTEEQAELLPVSEGEVSSLAFSPDGELLAAGFEIGNMRGGVVLWDVAQPARQRPRVLEVHEGAVSSIAFSHGTKTLAAGIRGVSEGGVVLWKGPGWERLETSMLPVIGGKVHSVAFSTNGRLLAAGINIFAGGNGAIIWDTTNRRRWITNPLPVPDGLVKRISFGDDSKTLTVVYDPLVRKPEMLEVRWDLDLKSWIRLAGQIANRNLTLAEWQEYFPDMPYRRTFPDLPIPPP
jgi:WD40 repeat protein